MKNFVENWFQNKSNNKKSYNIMTKVISVIAALVLWMYVIGEVNPEIIKEFRNVEVKLVNREKLSQTGLVIMDQDYFSVNIKIKGRRSDINNLSTDDIQAIANMRGFGQGENSIPVRVFIPSNLELKDVAPLQIKVTIDEVVKRAKPVTIEFEGTAAKGYIHGAPQISLPEVLVSGPKTFVESVNRIVGTVNLNQFNSDIHKRLPFKIVDSDNNEVRGVTTQETFIDVTVPMYRIKSVPIEVDGITGTPAEGHELISIIHIPSNVDIIGSKEIVEATQKITATPVSLEGLTATQSIDLKVNLPEGIRLADKKPPQIKVFIEKITEKELSYNIDEIQVEGLDDDLKIEFLENDPVKFVISDVESSINSLTKEDILVFLDLADLEEGQHSIRVTWQSDKEFKAVNIESGYVNINLIKE